MPNPVNEAAKIGSQKQYQNPNDPALTGGTYKDEAAERSPEQNSVLQNFPLAPAKSPFSIRGGV